MIAETNTSGTLQRSFVWGLDASGTTQGAGGVGGLLMIRDDYDTYYPIYDGSKNIVGLWDQDGVLAAAYEYDAFGRILNQDGTYASDNPF